MFFIIITFRSLFWILCSIGTFMMVLSALTTPKWLLGEVENKPIARNITQPLRRTLGIYNKCILERKFNGYFESKCIIYATTMGRIPSVAWRCCIVFLGIALIFLFVASIFAVVSVCKQLIRRKSLMNLAGIMQAFAGIALVVSIVLFPVGWDNKQVKWLCHSNEMKAERFKLGHCSIGLAYILALGATAASFFCSLFSFVADKAVFSHKVQDEILEGKHLICVP